MSALNRPLINILVSYPYCSPEIIDGLNRNKANIRFLLDCGAFTAWASGKVITLDEYCKFLENLPIKPWKYFALDVVEDPEQTQRNYEIMLSRGFNPTPVFTPGEDFCKIDELYKTSDVVAIGGLNGLGRKKLSYLQNVLDYIGRDRKYHLLGFANIEYLKYYKPYMCDSSTCSTSARFGRISLYCGGGKMMDVGRKDFQTKPSRYIKNLIDKTGEDFKLLRSDDNWRGTEGISNKITIINYLRFSFDLEKCLNVKYFLALSKAIDIRIITNFYNNYVK